MDDDQYLLSMYCTKFEKEGFEVESTSSSKQALAKFREGYTPAVFIVDIVMPEMSGIEVLEEIQREKLIPESVIVMLTNQGGNEQIERAKELGAAGYIVKATSIPSEVVEKVQEIYERETGSSAQNSTAAKESSAAASPNPAPPPHKPEVPEEGKPEGE